MIQPIANDVPPSKRTPAQLLRSGILLGYALLIVAGVIARGSSNARQLLSGGGLMIASLMAAWSCFVAWRSLTQRARVIWLLLGSASLLAAISYAAGVMGAADSSSDWVHAFWLLSFVLILAAMIAAIQQTEGARTRETMLDSALVVTTAALMVSRWAPGAHGAFGRDSNVTIFLMFAAPSIAVALLFFTVVLMTYPKRVMARRASLGIAGASISLALSTLPQARTSATCCYAGQWSTFAAIGVWVFIAYGALSAWHSGELQVQPRARERLRQFIAPTVAIVLAAVSIEAALNPPLGRGTALALGVLGALVALRLTELLVATRTLSTDRRELVQTRALVEVGQALAGKNDLDSTLNVVTEWTMRVLNARAATVELLSADEKSLVLRAASGLPGHAIGMTFPVDSSFTGWVLQNGKPRVASDPRRDPTLSPESLAFLDGSPLAAVPLRYRERLLGVLTAVGNRPFEGDDLELLSAFANQTAIALEDARLFEQVRALSVTDPLTGLANRRQLDRELMREFSAAQRGRKLVAVMLDLDEFKQHNDKHGHVAGDEALRRLAISLQSETRTMNLAARYGGDEFFALLADGDVAGAEVFVQRVRIRFRELMEEAGWPVLNVSAGIAEFDPSMETPEDLLLAADRALYVSKFDVDVSA